MCYDIKTKLETELRRAKHYNNEEAIRKIEEQLRPYLVDSYFHVSGFEHPKLLIYTKENYEIPKSAVWGLIPFWVKTQEQQLQLWNQTINARGETIFEKPSFRSSANNKRCVIYIDGFFEHHHFKGRTFPFFIEKANKEPLIIGGLWDEWRNRDSGEIISSFTIVTTKANALMSKIHNNPKLKEPRMPLFLKEENVEEWLTGNPDSIKKLIVPDTETKLNAHTVRKLRGKESHGNSPEASEEFKYTGFEFRA